MSSDSHTGGADDTRSDDERLTDEYCARYLGWTPPRSPAKVKGPAEDARKQALDRWRSRR